MGGCFHDVLLSPAVPWVYIQNTSFLTPLDPIPGLPNQLRDRDLDIHGFQCLLYDSKAPTELKTVLRVDGFLVALEL